MKAEMIPVVPLIGEEQISGRLHGVSLSLNALEKTLATSHTCDASVQIKESPQVMGFELASYAIPAGWRVQDNVENQLLNQKWLSKLANAALQPMVQQLPPGASLVTEYVLVPKGNGALSLKCRLGVEASENMASRLTHDLAVCLATLSDHFGFRDISDFASKSKGALETWVIQPLTAICIDPSGAMGFTHLEQKASTVRLPLPDSPTANEPWPEARTGAGSLENFIKAARAMRYGLRVRIRLVGESLPESTSETLGQLLNGDPAIVIGNAETGRLSGQTSLIQLMRGWIGSSRDILRLKAEVDCPVGHLPSGSLLRMLAAVLFPGLRVDIVSKSAVSGAASGTIDLSDAIPLTGPLPPLMPPPALLESLDFPRHFINPSVSLPADGILLGHAQVGGFEQPVRISECDRSRHVYLLGATGTGKSTLLLSMLRQDMEAGRGLALIDPHGDLFHLAMAAIPPQRRSDLVVINPADEKHAVGLNPLDFGGTPTLTRVNRVINDLLDIFGELWDMKEVAGPAFEQYFRNTFLLASTTPEDNPPEGLPKGPPTLLTAIEVMRNREFRDFLLDRCPMSYLGADVGGEVVRFFRSAHAVSGDHSFVNWVPYVTSKLARFTNNPQLRRLLCTPRRTVDFRQAIDRGAIILVKLSKGYLGDLDTRMIGMLITKYLFHAALSRGDVASSERRPFYLFLDEFQNFISLSRDVPDILSEARKYGLHLTLAHQTLGQFKSEGRSSMLDAVLGNVATKLMFRVGLQEAKQLEGEYLPHFDARAMTALPDRYVLARVLVNNKPSPPFVFKTADSPLPPTEEDAIPVDEMISTSQKPIQQGVAKAEAEIAERTQAADHQRNSANPSPMLLRRSLMVNFATTDRVHAIDLRKKLAHSMKHWRKHGSVVPSSSVSPREGKFFYTHNRSLVYIVSVTSEGGSKGMGRALVLTGGHHQIGMKGDFPGSIFTLNAEGAFNSDHPSLDLLGMGLAEEPGITLANAAALIAQIDLSGRWTLHLGPARRESKLDSLVRGFYRTLNNSVVFTLGDGDLSGWHRAIVCHGGHGINKLDGARPGESYRISSQGTCVQEIGAIQDMPAPFIAAASGMSLMEYLPLLGDVPELLRRPGNNGQEQAPAELEEIE